MWKAILATMLIFGTGVVTGGLLVKVSNGRGLKPLKQPGPRPQNFAPAGLRVEFLRRVERELDLEPGQKEKVDKILAASQERTRKLLEPVTPHIREEIQHTKEEIRDVLTPTQAARFDELLKQQRDRDRGPRRVPGNQQLHRSDGITATNAPATP